MGRVKIANIPKKTIARDMAIASTGLFMNLLNIFSAFCQYLIDCESSHGLKPIRLSMKLKITLHEGSLTLQQPSYKV